MKKLEFYRFIEKGVIQGACRYQEYWFVYNNLPGEGRVLELGAGQSALLQALKTKGLDVMATEIDSHCILYQTDRKIPCTLVLGQKLPFKDEFYDFVVSASSIEHFDANNDGDIEMIAEVKRVLKKGGLFIVTIPVFKKYIKNRYEGHPIHPPEKVYDKQEFSRRFLSGFRIVKQEFWRWSSKKPVDYIPHKNWRKEVVSVEPATSFDNASGLCLVLKKGGD